LVKEHPGNADSKALAERILGDFGDAQTAPDQQDVTNEERNHSHVAKHSADVRKDEVGLSDFEQVESALRATLKPVTKDAARTDADLRLDDVVALTLRITFRVERDQ